MIDILSEDKYNFDEADNGINALEQLTTRKADLVLLDVNMPGMNGFEVCAEIRRLYGETDISIVMVTGLGDAASIEKSFESGATDFIGKPINWDTFPYRIQYLVKAREAITETKNRESHLQYMEQISSIITQNKNKEPIMLEAMLALLKIFSADRVFVIKPDDSSDNDYTVDCEVNTRHTQSISKLSSSITNSLDDNIINRANNSEFPIVTYYDTSNPAPAPNPDLKQQMFKALQLQDNQIWYLVIQQCTNQADWTNLDEETFYRISIRLSGLLSRFLLTEKLQYNQHLLKLTQEISHLGNWNWNVSNNILSWSDEIYHIYGYQPEDYSPDFDEFYKYEFEEDLNRLNHLKLIQSKECSSYKIDHRIRTADNFIRWVREQVLGKFDDAGNLIEVDGIIQDITEDHMQKEQELHNNKMDAIGQLTSGVAHDFGNLMTVARGNLELLIDSLSTQDNIDKDDVELIEDAHSAIQDGVELTKQLLALSRKSSIAPVSVSINKTVNKFKKLFKNTLGDKIKLSLTIEKDLPEILVDPAQFESSLLNVIINARNAMPDGGTLAINAEVMTTERSQEIIRNADNDLGDECVCIYIKDSGTGMNNTVLERALEPFYTTKGNQGTGLGLSMVYGFIKQSGGELVIHSQPDKGTTIYMQFPIYDGAAAEKEALPGDEITLSDKKATILIVEDRTPVRQFAVRCLKQDGITILEANDANEAQQLLKTNNIDLLFTDILMPGEMNGHDLAEWARGKYPDLDILLTTAMESEPSSEQPVIDHSFQLLPKPYSKIELTESISKFL